MKNEIYEHFQPEERAFVNRAVEWIQRSAEFHELRRTEFLDPRQAHILTSLANRNMDVILKLDGGYEAAERRRAIIAPHYRSLEDEAADIHVLVAYAPGQDKLDLDHGDFLGALLGLGIKRDRIGDIHVHDAFTHIIVTHEIADYLNIHLRQVHRYAVMTEIVPLSKLQTVQATMEKQQLSVASMRLDGIASDVYRVSRAKIIDPIRAGRCKVNWKSIENPAEPLKQGDMVSFKGLGRFQVMNIEGVTKKGRFRVEIGKFI